MSKTQIKFEDLSVDLQQALFSTSQELAKKDFYFYPNPMSKEGILFLAILISTGSTVMLFVGGILAGKIAFLKILLWTFYWFIFISVMHALWAYPQYRKTATNSGYLLTDKYLLFFLNKDSVQLLSLETLDIAQGKDGFIFQAGEASFNVKYEYATDKKFSDFFAKIIFKTPRIMSKAGILLKDNKAEARTEDSK